MVHVSLAEQIPMWRFAKPTKFMATVLLLAVAASSLRPVHSSL